MRLARYICSGGDPEEDERLDIDDTGTFTLTRTSAIGRVGMFGGSLADADLTALRKAIESAPNVDDNTERGPSPGVMEHIETPKAQLNKPWHDDAPKPWRALLTKLRALTDDLTAQPVAAIEATSDGTTLVLSHVGPEPLDVDFTGSSVEVELYVGDDWEQSTSFALGDVAASITSPASDGWHMSIPIEHGLKLGEGRTLSIAITGRIRVDGLWRPARLAFVLRA